MNKKTFTLLSVGVIAAGAVLAGCGKSSSGSSPSTAYVFSSTPAGGYTQIDRVGMPAVNTAVITSKDAYNASTPSDDASGLYVGQITTDVANLHTTLDASISGAGR